MRKSIMALAVCFGVSGCAGSLPDPNSGTGVWSQVKQYVAQYCRFEATIDTIGDVVSALYPLGIPVIGGVEAVGRAICAAPTIASTRRGARLGELRKIVSTPRGKIVVRGIAK